MKTSSAPSLVQPLLLGMLLFLAFTAVCQLPQFSSPLLHRYMFGHPINKMSGLLFFVGMAAVGLAAWNVWRQRGALDAIRRKVTGSADQTALPERCENERQAEQDLAALLRKRLAELPAGARSHYLASRLDAVFAVIARDGATPALQARFPLLADDDFAKMAQRFAFPRILVWATPLLGFLGTVVGISAAMGNLNVGAENDLAQMMGGLQSNLNVAFDTTAQALVLSIILMFGVFGVERSETQLLSEVGRLTEEAVCDWFELADQPQVATADAGPATELLRVWTAECRSQLEQLSQQLAGEWQTVPERILEVWRQTNTTLASEFQQTAGQSARELQRMSAEVQSGWVHSAEAAANRVARAWEQAAEQEFQSAATAPVTARKLEAALVQLTSTLGELQRQLNLQRQPEETLRPATLPLERLAIPTRRAA